jgi:hypothetical protein
MSETDEVARQHRTQSRRGGEKRQPFQPKALANERVWVGWDLRLRANAQPGDEPTKVPIDPRTGREAKANDPNTWGTLAEAEWRAQQLRGRKSFVDGGIGLQFCELDDGRAIAGVDLDTCVAGGTIAPWAQAVIGRFASYTELSPSRTGLHILFTYPTEELQRLRDLGLIKQNGKGEPGYGRVFKKRGDGKHAPGIELRLGRRYFAVSWQHLENTPHTLREVSGANLEWLLREHGPAYAGTDPSQRATSGRTRQGSDNSRSAGPYAIAAAVKAVQGSYANFLQELRVAAETNARLASWLRDKGDERQLQRAWQYAPGPDDPEVDPEMLDDPDMGVLRLRRPPPKLPLDVFGPWQRWIEDVAAAAACPVDCVVAPLLASASVLVGHARWARATPGWKEPPHLWCVSVGRSGNGKSPGSDPMTRDALPVLELRMEGDFPERHRQWKESVVLREAALARWKKTAAKKDNQDDLPPVDDDPPEPQAPRLYVCDVTVEKLAVLQAGSPKGLLVVRDELIGWFTGMNAYNDAGRAFWIEG